jgi:WD40 repeat protein
VYTFRGHKDLVLSVAWSPDSTQIASASKDGTLQIWDALTGSPDEIFPPQG